MMTTPIAVLAVFDPVDGKYDDVLAVMQEFIPQVHHESGCDLYCIQRAEGSDRVVMFERWASVADLDAHAAGEIVKNLDRALDGLLIEPPEVTRLSPLPIGDSHRGQLRAAPADVS